MMKKNIGLFAICLTLIASAAPAGNTGGVDHTRKIKAYNGPSTCMECHSTSKMGSNLAEDVYNSAHFQLRTEGDKIDIPGGGIHGMMDRACGLPGTTLMANNYAGIATSATGSTRDDGCGKCHVAYKAPYYYASAADALNDLDCLICHADAYSPRTVETLSDGTKRWTQDRSLASAKTVGRLPKTEYCLRCHEHGLSRYKRATPYDAATDVHAARGVECADCHVMQQHKIARGNYVTDGVANDLTREVTCAASNCHASKPHIAANADALNKHTVNVTCEACHIPKMEGSRNIAKRSWAPYTMDPMTGQWLATPATQDGEFPGFWDAYSEYHDQYTPPVTAPSIRWFDGKASMLAQPFGGYAGRKSVGGCSKLFALKPFTSGMLFDAGFFSNPAAYSMKAYYEMNWQKLRELKLVDPKYLTAADYWNERPDMSQMLAQFPMMLQFDRTVFMAEAGNMVGEPVPGPQNAATFPGVAKAINVGMGKMAMDMGYCAPGTDLEICGQGMWSGTFFGMWVPVNMDQTSPFMGEIGSFITINHSIKSGVEMGEPCFTCHVTQAEYDLGPACDPTAKRVNFAKLGYPDKDGNGCIDPKYGDIEPVAAGPAVRKIDMKITSSNKGDTLTMTVTVADAATDQLLSGATVNATLTGPSTDSALPKSLSGTTGSKGTVTFTYLRKPLDAGLYTLTVNSLTYNNQTTTTDCSSSISK